MADRRGMRSSSRRMAPTPQPPSKPAAAPAGRAARRRGTRSASRDVELPVEPPKATRRSARQASVASDSEQDKVPASRTKRLGRKQVVTDLTTVEEADTHIVLADPATPPRPAAEITLPHRSPGNISEMSGTTAISSFSMVEAEMLEPRFILRHLPKLYKDVVDFLEHLVPSDGGILEDNRHMLEMQKPDSDYVADYNDYDRHLTLRLAHFRSEHPGYIHLRAVHRALFGPNGDSAASRSGLDLVLYLANMLILTKQMIHADRSESWGSLRELDHQFPTLFLSALDPASNPFESSAGNSALVQETFELALELRTQLAIAWLERNLNDPKFDPDGALEEVFFDKTEAIRGWSASALGSEASALPRTFQSKVVERLTAMRDFFPTDKASLKRGDLVDVDGLGALFPWPSVILRLLGWVRLRTSELKAAVEYHGGSTSIVERVKVEMQQSSAAESQGAAVPRASPRKRRSSFGRARRRSSRRFDPTADVNNSVLDRLIAKARGSDVQPQPESSVQMTQSVEEVEEEQYDSQPSPDESAQQQVTEEASEEPAGPSQPPRSTADTLKLLKEGKRLDKENRVASIFERQATAQRVEFGDGFDDESQAAPGPSRKGKEVQRSSPKKRKRPIEEDSDDDAFEAGERSNRVPQQRAKAKRVRIDPNSSFVPPSHQPPPPPRGDAEYQPSEREESPSETGAPERTQVAPPSSTYAEQKQLARLNRRATSETSDRPRKRRTIWTSEAEEAFMEYMRMFPQRYADILKHDKSEGGYRLLQDRTQVNLKDKARNMAIIMIKSGAGLRPGFEEVITPGSAMGRKLQDDGHEW